jgi:hypothetical protein
MKSIGEKPVVPVLGHIQIQLSECVTSRRRLTRARRWSSVLYTMPPKKRGPLHVNNKVYFGPR